MPDLTYTPDDGYAGPDSFTYTVTDDAGARSAPATVSITVDAPTPPPPTDHDPVARIAPVPTVTEGGTVVLDGTGSSDPDGDALSYHWVLDGSSYDGATVRVPFGDDFSGEATLTVDDGRGGDRPRSAPVVVQNAPPALMLDPLPDVVVGEPFELRGTVQDPGTDTHTATVDWGDGTHDTPDVGPAGLVVTHTYAAAGPTQLSLTVCDDDGGCVRREVPLDVAAASSPPTEPPGTTIPPEPGTTAPPPATTAPPPVGTTAPPTTTPTTVRRDRPAGTHRRLPVGSAPLHRLLTPVGGRAGAARHRPRRPPRRRTARHRQAPPAVTGCQRRSGPGWFSSASAPRSSVSKTSRSVSCSSR